MEKTNKNKLILFLVIVFLVIYTLIILIIDVKSGKLEFSYELFDNQKIINETTRVYSSEDYALEIQKLKEKTNKMLIFPETILDSSNCYGFTHIEEVNIIDWGKDYRAEVFFCIKYSKNSYDLEVDRLSLVESRKKVVFSQNLFNYPAYISIYNEHSRYEYALVDEDNLEIIYIYMFDCGKDSICFSNNYIPSKKLKKSDFPKQLISSGGEYTIYW